MITRIAKIDPKNIDKTIIKEAASILRNGGLVAFPTETVYGLGAIYNNTEAVKKIFIVKNRPMDNPLILHVASRSMFFELIREPTSFLEELIERVWPGPFTIVWWKSSSVPDIVTAGLPKVAVRMPAHNVALSLIEEVGEALAAPSANKAGKPSPTTARHVIDDLYGSIEMIIDAGETLYGVESTIVDLTTTPPTLLRPGALSIDDVEKIIGSKVYVPPFARGLGEAVEAVAPGMKYKHYAPDTPLTLIEARDYRDLSRLVKGVREYAVECLRRGLRIGVVCSSETCRDYSDLGVELFDIGSRADLFIVARNLFKTLREVGQRGLDKVIVEGFEEKGLGLTIMNRLRKASGGNRLIT